MRTLLYVMCLFIVLKNYSFDSDNFIIMCFGIDLWNSEFSVFGYICKSIYIYIYIFSKV